MLSVSSLAIKVWRLRQLIKLGLNSRIIGFQFEGNVGPSSIGPRHGVTAFDKSHQGLEAGMDTEDRDHFKTIASRQVGQPQNLQNLQSEENSSLHHDPAY